MKKHLIIGKPISHSLSPQIHNYWFKENNINGSYEKIEPENDELDNIVKQIKEKKIHGINVTVPYKQAVIPFLETLSPTAEKTNSVNTIYNKNGKIHGDNTDVYGFEQSIVNCELDLNDKYAFIFGAGGVVPSIITALTNLKIKKIYLSNRTNEKAEIIKKRFKFIQIIDWGKIKDCDFFINCTSVGLKKGDKINFNLNELSSDKIFYDIIYNPPVTSFLSEANSAGHKIINGRDMFIYQAQRAFNLWHNLTPKIDKNLIRHLFND